MSEVQDTNEAAIGQSGLTLVYEKLNGGDFGSISIRMYAQTQDGVVLWKSGEVNLHEGDTVTLTGITVVPNGSGNPTTEAAKQL